METAEKNLFRLFPTYLWRWTLFGAAAGFLLTPTAGENLLLERIQPGVIGAVAGVLTAVLFTIVQNTVNEPRKRWLSWVVGVLSWTAVKFALFFATQA